MRHLGAWTLAGLLVATTASCAGDDPDEDGGGAWPSTTSPVAADGLVWASGSEVHLPDGTTLDTGRQAGSYVVAGPGVWFASADGADLDPGELPVLRVATADGVEETDAHPAIGTLTATTDGRWVAFLDRLEDGAGAAEAVVVDTTTGEEVVRSQEGLVPDGDGDEDWADLYEDSPVGMLGVVDGTAYVTGLNVLVTHDLATGESTTSDLDWDAVRQSDWFLALDREPPLWNDDRSWQIPAQEFGADPVLESADGQRVTTSTDGPPTQLGLRDLEAPQLESWAVGGWLDDETVVGLTPTQDGGEEDWTSPALLTCTVPSGACELMKGTEEGVNLPADRHYGLPRERALAPD